MPLTDHLLGTVVGHDETRRILAKSATSGNMSHAWLFGGPSQVGKRTLALATAALLNCQNRPEAALSACAECPSCRLIARGSHPDVILLEGEDSTSAKADNVREVVGLTSMHPTLGPYRVFIITEVHELLLHAANALLKPLEEPPAATVLLLTSSQPERVLPTILSRCRPLSFGPVPGETIRSALVERWRASPTEAKEVAGMANGRVGWAVSALAEPDLRAQRQHEMDRLLRLPGAGRAERLKVAAELAPNVDGAQETVTLWLALWRDVVLAAHGATSFWTSGKTRERIESLGKALGPDKAEPFTTALLRAQTALEENGNPRLTLDVLLLDLPYVNG